MSQRKARNYGGRLYPLVLTGQKGAANDCLIEGGMATRNLSCE